MRVSLTVKPLLCEPMTFPVHFSCHERTSIWLLIALLQSFYLILSISIMFSLSSRLKNFTAKKHFRLLAFGANIQPALQDFFVPCDKTSKLTYTVKCFISSNAFISPLHYFCWWHIRISLNYIEHKCF